MKTSHLLKHLTVAFVAVGMVQCSSGATSSSGSSNDEAASVSSLTQVPSITEIVGEAASASLSSRALVKNAVSGTPPILSEITEEDADTIFWSGLLADIAELGEEDPIPEEMFQDFWHGEGACRMAQNVGYSFQNIQQAGTSICYIKNAPGASSGVEVVSGDVETSEVFAQTEDSKVVKVTPVNDPFEEENGEENIYIRVYGTDSIEGANGFAVDLWFCGEGDTVANGYEQVRVNNATGVITQHNVKDDETGTFVMDFTGQLTEDGEGNITFDREAAQTAVVTALSDEFGDFKASISVLGTTLTSKSYNVNTFDDQENINKNYIISEYSGSDSSELRFLTAGTANSWANGDNEDAFYAAVEFQDTGYVYNEEIDLLADVLDYDFDADTFFGELELAEEDTDTSDFGCTSVTVDIEVSMDMADTAFQNEVQALCENNFNEMRFCDGTNVMDARNRIMQAEFFGAPEE